jgi:hypothetical protein
VMRLACEAQAGAGESTQVQCDKKGIVDYGVRIRQLTWQASCARYNCKTVLL